MNINIKVESLLQWQKSQMRQRVIDSLHHLVDYCRGLENECAGAGVEALKDIAEESMNKKSYEAVKRAIENPNEKYQIILV